MLNRVLFRRHLDDDEELVAIVHKHWLVGARALFWPTLWVGSAIALLALQPGRPLFLAVSLTLIVLLVWWLRCFFDFFLDAWIITTSGVIDVAWHGWFHRESSRVLYSDIQGVSYEISGVWGTLLRFGTVSVEKISTGSAMSLEYVRNPRRVESLILKYMENYVHARNLKNSKHVQEMLAELIAGQLHARELEGSDGDDD